MTAAACRVRPGGRLFAFAGRLSHDKECTSQGSLKRRCLYEKLMIILIVIYLSFSISSTAFAMLNIERNDSNGQVSASSLTFYNDTNKKIGFTFLRCAGLWN